MFNIFVLEDNLLDQSRLESAILKTLKHKGVKGANLKIFDDAPQLLEAFTKRGFHQVFFLAIEIKGESKKGLVLAKQIRQMDPSATIVFVSRHTEWLSLTFQYQVCALDFIDKSLSEGEFTERISSAVEYVLMRSGSLLTQDYFNFETAQTRVQIPFVKIVYIETAPVVHKVILHTTDDRIEFYAGISEIEKMDDRFYRSHKSFVVNPYHIQKLDKESRLIYFTNGESCLVAKTKIKPLKEIMARLERNPRCG